jgi:hypothetical protein
MFSICECFKTEINPYCSILVKKGPQIVRCKRIATHQRHGIWVCDFHRLQEQISESRRQSIDAKSDVSN